MSKWKQQTQIVKQLLEQTQEYQDYIALQQAIDASNFHELEKQLKDLQQAMTIALDENQMERHLALVAEYKQRKQYFDNHPLYINYIQAKRTLNDLLQEMASILTF